MGRSDWYVVCIQVTARAQLTIYAMLQSRRDEASDAKGRQLVVVYAPTDESDYWSFDLESVERRTVGNHDTESVQRYSRLLTSVAHD